MFAGTPVAGGLLDLGFDLTHAGLDGIAIALAADDGGVVLAHCNRFDSKEFAAIAVDADLLALAEHAEVGVLELVAFLFADDGATGEDGDVFEHLFAAVAEAVNALPCTLLLRGFFVPSL